MKRFATQLLVLVAVAQIGIQPCMSQTDDAVVSKRFEEALDAQFEQDFAALADFMHPSTLRFFRDYMNVMYEKLAEHYDEKELQQAIGIDSSPEQSHLSDKNLFITICRRAATLNPTFSGDEKYLPITLHGIVFSENNQAYVVYDYADKEDSKESTVRFKTPGLTTFTKVGDDWLMKSAAFTNVLPRVWSRELYRQRSSKSNGQQDGADQPATAPESEPKGNLNPKPESKARPQ